jgi:hypothetical protein
MYRGSRKHILDWVEQPRFLPELLDLALPVECRVSGQSQWLPMGYRMTAEARLDTFGPRALPDNSAWQTIRSWWLQHERGANTPNWDIALSCDVEDRPGLILVEAKANEPELSEAGKGCDASSSQASRDNHARIATAINEARHALEPQLPGICIARDSHYQLSNRIAFAWKLASLGIPTVLIYLGFTADVGITDVGTPFSDDAHWSRIFEAHLRQVCPSPLVGRSVDAGPACFWLLARSRAVLEPSSRAIRHPLP